MIRTSDKVAADVKATGHGAGVTVLKEGFLLKRSQKGVVRTWDRRFFTLNSQGLLFYQSAKVGAGLCPVKLTVLLVLLQCYVGLLGSINVLGSCCGQAVHEIVCTAIPQMCRDCSFQACPSVCFCYGASWLSRQLLCISTCRRGQMGGA